MMSIVYFEQFRDFLKENNKKLHLRTTQSLCSGIIQIGWNYSVCKTYRKTMGENEVLLALFSEDNAWSLSMDKQKIKQIEVILDGYFRGEGDESLSRDIQSWILSPNSEAEKNVALWNVWERYIRNNPGFGPRAEKAWQQRCRELGFSPMGAAHKTRSLHTVKLKVAAIIIPFLLLAGTIWWSLNRRVVEQPIDAVADVSCVVPVGAREEITLPCGSRIRVFEGTQIRYGENFLEDRNLYLEGEAYFVIEPLDGKPFTVETSNLSVTVLGTEFNLRDYPGERKADVSLAKGSVEVSADDRKIVLEPNERLIIDHYTREIELTNFERKQLENRWDKQLLIMDDVPLVDALRQVAEYYGKTVRFEGALPANRAIRLPVYPDDNLKEILEVLQSVNKTFTYEIANDSIVIKRTGGGI